MWWRRRDPDAFTLGSDTKPYLFSLPVPADPVLSSSLRRHLAARLGEDGVVEGMNATADSFYSSQVGSTVRRRLGAVEGRQAGVAGVLGHGSVSCWGMCRNTHCWQREGRGLTWVRRVRSSAPPFQVALGSSPMEPWGWLPVDVAGPAGPV